MRFGEWSECFVLFFKLARARSIHYHIHTTPAKHPSLTHNPASDTPHTAQGTPRRPTDRGACCYRRCCPYTQQPAAPPRRLPRASASLAPSLASLAGPAQQDDKTRGPPGRGEGGGCGRHHDGCPAADDARVRAGAAGGGAAGFGAGGAWAAARAGAAERDPHLVLHQHERRHAGTKLLVWIWVDGWAKLRGGRSVPPPLYTRLTSHLTPPLSSPTPNT